MLSIFENTDITNITMGGKRRKQFLLDSDLLDSTLAGTSHHGQDKRADLPTGPVNRPESPDNFESEEHEFWQSDEVTASEREALQPIILNPAMHELKGTSESAVLAKWHMLCGHINTKYLRQIASRIPGMEEVARLSGKVKLPVCETCNLGKSKHKPLPKKTLKRSTKLLHRIHTDMSGHIRVATNDGAHYFLLFIEDKTGYKFVALLRTKDEYLDALHHLCIQLGQAPEVLRLDNAGEFHSQKAYEYYELMRIWIEACNAYEHHQSGRAEAGIGSISMRARVLIVQSGLTMNFWGFAVRYAVHIENRFLPTTPESLITCYEAFHGSAPDSTIMHPFGCLAFLHIDVERRAIKKLSETSVACVFLGLAHDLGHKGYLLKQLSKNRYYIAFRSVTFDDARFPYRKDLLPSEHQSTATVQWQTLEDDTTEANEEQYDGSNFEIILEDESESPTHAPQQAQLLSDNETRQILTRSMTRDRAAKGDNVNSLQQDVLIEDEDRAEIICDPDPEVFEPAEPEPAAPADPEPDPYLLSPSHIAMSANASFQKAKRLPSKMMKACLGHNAIAFLGLMAVMGISVSMNVPVAQAYFAAMLATTRYSFDDEPKSLEEALNRADADLWWQATIDEWQSFIELDVFEEQDLPAGRKAIDTRLVYKVKRDANNLPIRWKARLVARGFMAEEGVDFFETFSAMSHPVHIRALMALAVQKGWTTNQTDISTAYLYGEIEEEIFLTPPKGLEHLVTPGKVMRLKKGVYGLSQSGRVFYKQLIQEIQNYESQGTTVTAVTEDKCIHIIQRGTSTLVIATVVDDMLQITNDETLLNDFNSYIKQRYKTTDNGPVKWFLGVNFRQYKDGSFHTSQTAFIEKMLTKFGIDGKDECKTPLEKGFTISDEDLTDNPLPEHVNLARQILGSLTYVQMWTRPDISYPVNMMARHVVKATASYIEKLRKILRYLKGTKTYGLKFSAVDPLGHPDGLLYSYVDASDADCKQTRRSSGGYIIMYNGTAISWRSARQPLVTLSTAESEYVQATLTCQEILNLRNLYHEMGFGQDAPTLLFEDNQAAIDLSKNPCSRGRTKHMERRWHFVRQCNDDHSIMLSKVKGTINPADTMTKALPYDPYVMYRRMLGVLPPGM